MHSRVPQGSRGAFVRADEGRMSEFFEAVKTAGSLAGWVSAAFLVWDRFKRNRPNVHFHVERFMGGSNKLTKLALVNSSRASIWVRSVSSSSPSVKVWKDDSIDA